MEEEEYEAEGDSGTGTGTGAGSPKIVTHWWWGAASAGQLGLGIASFRRGYAGHSNLMPLKAFAVASLFVGAAASASFAALHASGIHKVEDMMEVGANIRTGLGIRPRARDE
ncbi:StAR lipid transfer-like protein [Parasponia andersonii]|uniref:StAR lipid transfer-like protein n=1 Tax=Parasponia andersonii TaxID=3476 RepID=A0A2P5CIM2_PARAD|nr:StAR lipid transfer-like protein [Parasponia andersonii]